MTSTELKYSFLGCREPIGLSGSQSNHFNLTMIEMLVGIQHCRKVSNIETLKFAKLPCNYGSVNTCPTGILPMHFSSAEQLFLHISSKSSAYLLN